MAPEKGVPKMRRTVLALAAAVALLAPAAASIDQFANYAERGNLFAEAARSLGSGA